ncbi:hypothetical protein JL722_14549 [Aureococcus anophagefferens]|nr:hypothetical protein JL722_14549 [Aureococcus anophagefferens]
MSDPALAPSNASAGSARAADAARPSSGDAPAAAAAGDDVRRGQADAPRPEARSLKQSQRDEYAKMAAKLCALGATDAHATTLAKVKGLDAELAAAGAAKPVGGGQDLEDLAARGRALDGVAGRR